MTLNRIHGSRGSRLTDEAGVTEEPNQDGTDIALVSRGGLVLVEIVAEQLFRRVARLEVQVGLASLMARFANVQLAIPRDEVPNIRARFLHGVVMGFPVAW